MRFVTRKPGVKTALSLAMLSTILLSGNQSAFAQLGGIDLSQIPQMLDIDTRRTALEKAVNDGLASGRLTAADAASLQKDLLTIKANEEAFRQSGKFSIWQKTRMSLQLDVISGNLDRAMGTRQTANLTDLPGRQAELSARIASALKSSSLSSLEANDLNTQLDLIKNKEASFKTAGALTSSQTLEVALDLDKLSSRLESLLRAHNGADVNFATRRTELQSRLSDLVTTGRITSTDATGITQEIERIANREATMRLGGRTLTTEDNLSLALDLERVNSRLERYTSGIANTSGMPGIDAMQTELDKKISDASLAGKLTSQQNADLKQDFERINQIERNYKADGVLTDTETLTLSSELENLNKRIDSALAANTPATTNSLAAKQDDLLKKLESAKTANRISAIQYNDLRVRLDQAAARERLYRADGVLTDVETLSLANDLDGIGAQINSSMSALPDINSLKTALQNRIQEGLGSGRLSASAESDLRADLARVAQLESAFKSGGRSLADDQVTALANEYKTINGRLDKTMTPLPAVADKRSALEQRVNQGEASGVLNAAQSSDMKRELARIASVESNFRASDNGLSDWEAMTISRDLDRLDSDLSRLLTAAPAPTASGAGAPFDTKGHWAESYVGQLTQRSIIGGFPDGSFKPDDGITRAQFAAIAVKALNLPQASGPATFRDVATNYWGAKAIAAVSQAGLVTGFPDGTFKPEDKITRAQALVILAKALPAGIADVSILNSYQDGSQVPAWAAPSVAKAAKARILVSYPDPSAIRPNTNATRADVAALTYQTLINLGQKLPQIRVGLE